MAKKEEQLHYLGKYDEVVSTKPIRGTLGGEKFEARAIYRHSFYIVYRKVNDKDAFERNKYDSVVKDGTRFLGTDGGRPNSIISKVVVEVASGNYKKPPTYFLLPKNLFADVANMHLGEEYYDSTFQIYKKSYAGTSLIGAQIGGGDGCGSYKIIWEINKKLKKARRIVRTGHAEKFSLSDDWYDLQIVSKPNFIFDN